MIPGILAIQVGILLPELAADGWPSRSKHNPSWLSKMPVTREEEQISQRHCWCTLDNVPASTCR